jgi:hypothetical protein
VASAALHPIGLGRLIMARQTTHAQYEGAGAQVCRRACIPDLADIQQVDESSKKPASSLVNDTNC